MDECTAASRGLARGHDAVRAPAPRPGLDWDAVAQLRSEQIESGVDVSYTRVLVPAVLALLDGLPVPRIVDVGCGTGYLTRLLALRAEYVDATDPSLESIRIARSRHAAANISYHHQDIESFARATERGDYHVAVANMTLMCVSDLAAGLTAIADLLTPGGRLVATIPHPAHWPRYAGYASQPWYIPRIANYGEIKISWPYKVSTDDREGAEVIHYLRSLMFYSLAFESAGMYIECIRELFPDSETEKLYPAPWKFPRYLAFRARKAGVSDR